MSCHVLYLLVLAFLLFWENGNTSTSEYELQSELWSEPKIIKIAPHSTFHVIVTGIPSSTSYIICEVHTQYLNITLSANPKITAETSVTGSNIGTVTALGEKQVNASWYLMSNHNITINALVYVIHLSENDPLPGGCNLEFNLENDPNIHFQYNTHVTTIEFQWSNVGYSPQSIAPDCELPYFQNQLEYELYVYYLTENDFSEETYFNAVKDMRDGDHIVQNGRKLKSLQNAHSTKSKVSLGSYVGQGAIYGIVVKQQNSIGITMDAYVPIVTYGCDLNNQSQTCQATGIIWKIFAVIGGVAGLFLCFAGHRYFKIELFFAGFLAVMLISYILLNLYTALSITALVILSAVFGIVGGVLWVMFWWAYGLSVLSVLLFGLVGGYLVSSIIFYSPFGNLEYWSKMFNYGMSFTCGVLILPVILLSFTKLLSILSCAFIGGYMVVLCIDTFLNSGIKYIIVNSVRHAVVDGYIGVTVTSPFLSIDIVLACLWGILFVSGTVFQLYREKGRPDFPPCPRKIRRQQMPTIPWRQRISTEENEEQPLIRDGQYTVYGSNRQPPGGESNHQEELNHPGATE